MKKIGEFIQSAREQKGLSLHEVSKETKIKPELLDDIENERWEKLPELPVLIGFVKNIAVTLDLNKDQVVALLRRDYPPKKLTVNPKPNVSSRWQIGPKSIVASLVLLIMVAVGGYLYYQYQVFVSPPKLTIIAPNNNDHITTKTLTVRGTTDTTAVVRVNNQPANVTDDGSFTAEIDVIPETHDIEIKATSRSGKVTTVHRTIYVDTK